MIIGLTGGIGSGKSTVAAMLAERGAVIIDTDEIAREVVRPGLPALDRIRERFGEAVIKSDGSLDRPALAALVFGDEGKRSELNSLLHPLIRARVDERLTKVGSNELAVVVVPLLFESKVDWPFDLRVAVVAPRDVRLARTTARDGAAITDVEARMRVQLPDEHYERQADVVIRNDGDLATLERGVTNLLERIARA